MIAYSDPTREADPHSLPDVETFHESQQDFIRSDPGSVQGIRLADTIRDGFDRFTAAAELAGWYWWSCNPGYLPVSDPFGPFDTEAIALADARDTGE